MCTYTNLILYIIKNCHYIFLYLNIYLFSSYFYLISFSVKISIKYYINELNKKKHLKDEKIIIK